MNELLVEWTLLREQDYLNKCLGLNVKKKIFQQYSTEYGRIDFAHELSDGSIAITELETIIDNKSKLEYCQFQTLEYSKIIFQGMKKSLIVVLIADETPNKFKTQLKTFVDENDFLLKTYSLSVVNDYYKQLIEEAVKNSGVPLVKPVANNFTHLSCLNRFILPFYDLEKDELKRTDFIDNFNYEFAIVKGFSKAGVKRIDLSIEQRRILLESLMNGNIGDLKGKVNLLYFLRFVH